MTCSLDNNSVLHSSSIARCDGGIFKKVSFPQSTLVTSCDNRTLYQWSIADKQPTIRHQLQFTKEWSVSFPHSAVYVVVDPLH